ncbi:MAG: hypothetical protein V4590_13940 [Bacteroidota bacterium]
MPTTNYPTMTFICDQHWDSMTPTPNGRFCGMCNHEVFDFSGKSPAEINEVQSTHHGELCGRFILLPDPNIIAPITTPKPIKLFTLFSSIFLSVSFKTLSAQITHPIEIEQPMGKSTKHPIADTIFVECDSTQQQHVPDAAVAKDTPKPFLTTKRKEYYWTRKFPFVTKTYKPVKRPTMIMGRFL